MSFNYDSFFNKFILADNGDSISTIVSNLSDEDFESLCLSLGVRKFEIVEVEIPTNIKYINGWVSISEFKEKTDKLNVLFDATVNSYGPQLNAKICIGRKDDNYCVYVQFERLLSNFVRCTKAVDILGRCKSKALNKRKKLNESKALEPKTVIVDGIEYILMPKNSL